MATVALMGRNSLRGELAAAAWKVLRHTDDWKNGAHQTEVHCHGAFSLPGGHEVVVLVGAKSPSASETWLTDEVRHCAAELLKEHEAKVAEFEEEYRRKNQELVEFHHRHAEMEKYRGWGEAAIAMTGLHQRPVLTAERLLPQLSKAAIFPVAKNPSPNVVEREATKAIAESGWPTARDGTYVGLLFIPVGQQRTGLVTWEPYSGPPSYPEVRWTVQRRLPHALRSPRITDTGRPEFDASSHPGEDTGIVTEIVSGQSDWNGAVEDVQLDQSEFRQRVDQIRRDINAHGFDAIAWFQPYHLSTEETWGIYVDAHKLDDLALSFLDDFKAQRIHGSHSDAARLAFGLTYAHEMFHARVEAALSWLEVNALQPRHLRYKQRVYNALRETPDWLEEALANFSAWDWFRSEPVQALFSSSMPTLDGLQRVVESSLDLSPPGYRDWRVGHQAATWRTFATQLTTGSPKRTSLAIGLPLESTLKGPLPYDFRAADIPLWLAGRGVIVDRLQSHPATFNVPTRRELERALKHFKHMVDPSGGKGGHQKWTGPDRRAFILPTRDPVSVGVFKTFLQHLGIDKATYVRDVRPNL